MLALGGRVNALTDGPATGVVWALVARRFPCGRLLTVRSAPKSPVGVGRTPRPHEGSIPMTSPRKSVEPALIGHPGYGWCFPCEPPTADRPRPRPGGPRGVGPSTASPIGRTRSAKISCAGRGPGPSRHCSGTSPSGPASTARIPEDLPVWHPRRGSSMRSVLVWRGAMARH